MTDDLRDLVDQLTREHTVPVHQHGRLLGHRTQRPLLTLLSEARIANIGTGTGGTLRHERVTLNLAASELYTAIHTTIRRWARHAHVPDWINRDNPATLLTAWRARVYLDNHLELETAQLSAWTHAINDLILDPPRHWAIEAPCPICTNRWAGSLDGDRIDALQVAERDPVHTSTTTCRACGAQWDGIDGARALRIAIDQHARQAS